MKNNLLTQKTLLRYIDEEFNLATYAGIDKSTNGFEISCEGEISKIALAVDACQETVDMAIAHKAHLLMVHHGFYWGKPLPITGRHYKVVKKAIKAGLGVLALHLPLDMHRVYGNNIGICKLLNLKYLENVGNYKGLALLMLAAPRGSKPLLGSELVQRITSKLEKPLAVFGTAQQQVNKIAICSGGGLGFIQEAAENNCNVLITGDAGHTSFHEAKELNILVISCGHYASETLGVKSFGKALRNKYEVETFFLDVPTHL